MSITGIDVSKWQGAIDWARVAASGVKVAIIRSGYGKQSSQKDPFFEANYSGAGGAGIPVGTYWYSYALSTADAEAEAAVCLAAINGKAFDYPVYYDIEESSQAALGKAVCTTMAKAFCEKIKAGGYIPGVYANLNYFTNYLDTSALSSYSLWLARYNSTSDYSNSIYDMHQHSSTGSVSGIIGNVDMNHVFKEFSGRDNWDAESSDAVAVPSSGTPSAEVVKAHQQWYNDAYYPSTGFKIAVDGIVGANTKKAFIMAYQTELNKQYNAGLSVDGIWGTKTYNASVSVKKGASGMLTHILQCLLYFNGYELAIDEVFGTATETAVKAFQSANGLTADGIAGKNTFKALFAGLS